MGSDEQELEKPLSWWRKWVADVVLYWKNLCLVQQFEIEKIGNISWYICPMDLLSYSKEKYKKNIIYTFSSVGKLKIPNKTP